MAKQNTIDTVTDKSLRQPASVGKENSSVHRIGINSRAVIASSTGALLLFLITYLLRMDSVVGLYTDDAWYVLLGKALATGHGFTLINSPSPGIFPSLYPPAYPFLLSLIWRLNPQFPQNVWMLKSVSIIAMAGAGIAVYLYLRRLRDLSHYQSLGIALAAVTCPAMVFLLTSNVLSEGVFTLATVLTLVAAEQAVRTCGKKMWSYTLLSAALASFAYLTRSIALALIIAVFVYLLRERLIRLAVFFALGIVLFVGPWKFYAMAHAPTPVQLAEQGGYISQNYSTQFWQRKASVISSGWITAADLPHRVWRNLVKITGHSIEVVILGAFHQDDADEDALGIGSFILSALVIAGVILAVRERVTLLEIYVALTIMIIVLWPWDPLRFVLPLSPFVIYYLFRGVRGLYDLLQRRQPPSNLQVQAIVLASVIWCLVALNTFGNVRRSMALHGPQDGHPEQNLIFDESRKMLIWAREHLPDNAVIASDNPALVYLFTGRRTISSDEPDKNVDKWNKLGVRYTVGPWNQQFILATPFSPEGKYKTIYQSDRRANLQVVDFGPKVLTLPWETLVSRE